jgi:regulator of cell morphogenesis and NO signaling
VYEIDTNISAESRLADVTIEYPNVMNALDYFEIPLGLGDMTIAETAAKYGIASSTLEVAIAVYCGETPSKILVESEIPDLLRFLKASHYSFKLDKIPELKRLIALFSEQIPQEQGKVLVAFFDEYVAEVYKHFRYEDETVFPYINGILNDRTPGDFRIKDFEDNHTDIEQKLIDLKRILVKYIPPSAVSPHRKQILLKLITLEQDLTYHTNIEENILVPFVKSLEGDF